jgi:hypothetical protein
MENRMASNLDYNLDLCSYWNSSRDFHTDGKILVEALVQSGKMSYKQAVDFVSAFQSDAFHDGESNEAFNSCGEGA